MHLLIEKSDGGKMRVQRRIVTCRIRIMTNKIKKYTCKHKIVSVWEKRSAGSPRLTGESVLSRGAWWRRCTTANRGVAIDRRGLHNRRRMGGRAAWWNNTVNDAQCLRRPERWFWSFYATYSVVCVAAWDNYDRRDCNYYCYSGAEKTSSTVQ